MHYCEGLNEALAGVKLMSREDLLSHLDCLYGQENLPMNFTDEELLEEAIRQTYEDFEIKY
jgi:hypothetical protein